MPPPDLVPTVFSTAGVPAARRVELWEQHNANALIGLDVHAAEPLEATERNVQLPQARLARVQGSAHAVQRSADVIEHSPDDAIAVFLTLRGDASFVCTDGVRALRPGNVLICETDRPFFREFAHGLEELVVKVPRPAFAGLADTTSLPEPIVVTFGGDGRIDHHARALARIADRATRPARPLPADQGTVLDLVALLAWGADATRATAHRAAARSYITEHLTNPELGADEIAAAIGISERQLSRVFAADGTSVPRHILSRRLQLAYSILSSGATADRTVAEIAARCGFTSITYFSHVFRQHFGQRASDVRPADRRSLGSASGWGAGGCARRGVRGVRCVKCGHAAGPADPVPAERSQCRSRQPHESTPARRAARQRPPPALPTHRCELLISAI